MNLILVTITQNSQQQNLESARNIMCLGYKLFKVFYTEKKSQLFGTKKFSDLSSFDKFHYFKFLFVWGKVVNRQTSLFLHFQDENLEE